MKLDSLKPYENLIKTLDECVELLDSQLTDPLDVEELDVPLPSLLQQCEELIGADRNQNESVRTLHHFASTGGTLIAKCLASMPNTHLLSEVEPHSKMLTEQFSPTDLIRLSRNSSRPSSQNLESRIFLAAIDVLVEHCKQNGLHLVLRDHAHSRYCHGDMNDETPSLRRTILSRYDTLAVVTVRHPIDSFLSATNSNFLEGDLRSIDEYCRRYLQFLRDHDGCPLFRYEDFLASPTGVMQSMCKELKLNYGEHFQDTFYAHQLSGDSGRRGSRIESRPRRAVDPEIRSQISRSSHYEELIEMLGYS